MKSILFFSVVALVACGGSIGSGSSAAPGPDVAPVDVVDPSKPVPEQLGPTAQLPAGDCHSTTASAPQVVFTPFAAPTRSYPSPNSIAAVGGRIYTALRGAESGPYVGPISIYVGGVGVDFQTFTTVTESSFLFQGGPLIGTRHVYWWQQVGSEWSVNPTRLAFRDADGNAKEVFDTDTNYGAASAVSGDDVFALTCKDARPENTGCNQPGSGYTLFATGLEMGTRSWTLDLPPESGRIWAPLAVGARRLYWSGRLPIQDAPAHLFGVDRDGSNLAEVPLETGDEVASIVPEGDDVRVFVMNANKLSMFTVMGGKPQTRIAIGTTSAAPLVALDRESVYFTTDDAVAWPDTTRTLMRACKDGSNVVPLMQGNSDGTAANVGISALSVDATRVYFTSANQVLALAK